jgi:hypothetical protein
MNRYARGQTPGVTLGSGGHVTSRYTWGLTPGVTTRSAS